MRYEENIPKIPAVAVGAETADALEKSLLSQNKISAILNSNCGMNGEALTKSVVAEIKGQKGQSVIVVSGHLDSWDVGEGAHDDGTGIVQSIEVLRTFKKLNLSNNHTIRVICYANEENGVRGGRTYLESLKKSNEPHIFALESDSGGFTPRSFTLGMSPEKAQSMKKWEKLFNPYGIYEFAGDYSGVDIEPLRELKIPTSELVTDSQRYFDIHHTPEDTFEKVNRRELLLGATVMTQLIYMIDQNW
jgi:Zn-dependent M28 family amino/carboxypeptidase